MKKIICITFAIIGLAILTLDPISAAENTTVHTSDKSKKQEPALEAKVGPDAGKIVSKNLPLNLRISYEEKTFEKETAISIYCLDIEPELPMYEKIGPVWMVKTETQFLKPATFTFEYEDKFYPDAANIVVLTWWRDKWIIAGFPDVDDDKNTVTVKADHRGWFVPVRTKLRGEIKMEKYSFADEERRKLDIIGFFRCETKMRKGDELLNEKIEFGENFRGEVTFGPIGRTVRTGVKLLYAKSAGDPEIYFYQSALSGPKKKITARSYEFPKDRGLITAKQKSELLQFQAMPTVIRLISIVGDDIVVLPTVRDKMNLSKIAFDWKIQEMFHRKNFIYSTHLTMVHGARDELTDITLYFQFIIH